MVETERKQKGRSPRYPGIPLELAVDRVTNLYTREGRYATNVHTALSHWGYGPKSGGGAVAVAALKAFGLVDDSGSGDARTIQVTERGEDIALQQGPARMQALQAAALAPPAMKDLWDRYGAQLPSDVSVVLYLTRERGFTPTGGAEFLSVYKRSINYAGLTGRDDTVSPDVSPQPTQPEKAAQEPKRPAGAVTQVGSLSTTTLNIPVPLVDGGMASFSLPSQISQESWDQMLAVLNAYRALIVKRAPQGNDDGDDAQ